MDGLSFSFSFSLLRRTNFDLHEAAQRTDAGDADLRAGVRILYTALRVGRILVCDAVIEHGHAGRLGTGEATLLTWRLQCIRRVQGKGGVVGLDTVAPDSTIYIP